MTALPPPVAAPNRIAFSTAAGQRSLRMTGRILEELQRRGSHRGTVAIGATVPEVGGAGECFPALRAEEAIRLASACVWLDAGAEGEAADPFTLVVAFAGYPLVVPPWSPVAGRPNVRAAAEWSADAFCDALMAPPVASSPDREAFDEARERLLKASRA